jgi:hypothetical protein
MNAWKMAQWATLAAVAAGIILSWGDIRRYIKIERM